MTGERLVDIGGVHLRCVFDGPVAGRPVLLLHGGGSRAATWAALSAALNARGYATLAPDLRGHGGSSRSHDYTLRSYHADISRLLDALGVETTDIVAHSLGAYVAIALARTSPERCGRLVLEEPPPPPRTYRRSASRTWRNNLTMLLGGLRHRGFDPGAVRSVVKELQRPDPTWWSDLTLVTAATLLVSGGRRSHIDQDDLLAIARRIPRCRHTTIAVGHRVHSRAPQHFNDSVLAFLSSPSTQH